MRSVILLLGWAITLLSIAAGNPFVFSEPTLSPLGVKPVKPRWISISLHYATVAEVKLLLKNEAGAIQSQRLKLAYDQRTRQLLMLATPGQVQCLKKLIAKIDVPSRQVLIRAKIINVDKDYLSQLGVSYFSSSSTGLKQHTDQLQIPIFRFAASAMINARINLLQQHGHATVIANPVLFTLDHQSASIESGAEIPYQQATRSGATSIAFKKAVLRLKITPDVLSRGRVLLSIQVNQDGVSNLMVNGEPAIKTQQLTTKVMLKNNQVVLLGGIIHSVNTTTVKGVPLLGRLPLLGALFRSTHRLQQHKVLLLLVSPTIL